jgi:hypothetical protein
LLVFLAYVIDSRARFLMESMQRCAHVMCVCAFTYINLRYLKFMLECIWVRRLSFTRPFIGPNKNNSWFQVSQPCFIWVGRSENILFKKIFYLKYAITESPVSYMCFARDKRIKAFSSFFSRSCNVRIQCWVSNRVFLHNSLGGWCESIQMNWLPNDSSAKGANSLGGSGICPLENFEN